MNKKYQTIKMTPRRRSSFHPFKCTDISKNTTVDNNDNVEYVKPEMFKNVNSIIIGEYTLLANFDKFSNPNSSPKTKEKRKPKRKKKKKIKCANLLK